MSSVSRCCRGAWQPAQGLYGLVLLPQLQIEVLSPGSYVAPSRVGWSLCACQPQWEGQRPCIVSAALRPGRPTLATHSR